ncbi:DUF1284 domain-containing protein [Paenibacillus sp. GCM10023252]|uniref:DUF1284 domain-containing protein n=1 Tax=Paenibacillus sp. GCM10023252 TaxID=3252649 RepID=UPI00360EC324
MSTAIRLRGHHLLCLLGFRGMGYSEAFCNNMSVIYERLRESPETLIEIVVGPDDLCRFYPADKPNHCEGGVMEQDQEVLAKLGLQPGYIGAWSNVTSQVAMQVLPSDISHLCAGCPWESYGVCQEGVGLVAEGKPLPPLKPAKK